MKKIIKLILISLLPLLIFISIVRAYTLDENINDCMLTYDKTKKWYLYKLDDYKYHIDNKKLSYLDLIWYSDWCSMIWDSKYSYMLISNSIYCSVINIIKK